MKKVMPIVIISSLGLIIAGCGGGGSSSSTTITTPDTFSTAGFLEVGNTQYNAAAVSEPKQGSVIQSSINTVPGLGIDASKDGINFSSVAGGQNVSLGSGDVIYSESETEGVLSYDLNAYQQTLTGGEFLSIAATAEYDAGNNDYLTFGFWAYVPSVNPETNAEIGFFTDGGDPFDVDNIAGLTGTADYEGVALGFYREDDFAEFFTGYVELAADFNSNQVSGNIDNIIGDDDGEVPGANIELQAADISIGLEGGFWTGDTLTTISDDGSNREYEGKWGGQFYGNGASTSEQPGYAAGTFGGSGNEPVDNNGAFVGAFVAERE